MLIQNFLHHSRILTLTLTFAHRQILLRPLTLNFVSFFQGWCLTISWEFSYLLLQLMRIFSGLSAGFFSSLNAHLDIFWLFSLLLLSHDLSSISNGVYNLVVLFITKLFLFLMGKLLSLILISSSVFLWQNLKFLLIFIWHPLPENADLFHYLTWIPFGISFLQFLAFLLREEDVRGEGSAGTLVDWSARLYALFIHLKLCWLLFLLHTFVFWVCWFLNVGITIVILILNIW